MNKALGRTLATSTVLATAIAIAVAVAAPRNAPFNPLQVRIAAVNAQAGDLLGAVEIVVTNTSNKVVRVPKWQLPSDFPETSLFRITQDGKPVAYEGAQVKRGLPQAEDFAILRPQQSLRTVVDLSSSYDLSKSGNYEVTLASPLQYASLSDGSMLRSERGTPMVMRSQPLKLWVDGSDVLGAEKAAKGKPGSGGTVVNGVSYVGCSTTQISTAGNAVIAARNYSENAKNYLASGATGPRYGTWFGAYTSSRYGTVRGNFTAIDTALDQNAGQIKINCGCNQSYYAYVYPTRPYEIFVCRAFWNAPLTGTDSKAGTLIHETSHFNAVAGTDDIVYGQSGAKSLALSDPASAIQNADSHEYFAENTPQQN